MILAVCGQAVAAKLCFHGDENMGLFGCASRWSIHCCADSFPRPRTRF